MMSKVLGPSQLTSQPSSPIAIPSQFPQDRAAWFHIINLSPYVFEIQGEDGIVRSVVSAFKERAVRLKVRTDQLLLSAVATQSANGVAPSSNEGTVTTPAANQVIVGVGLVGSGANFPAGLYQLTAGAWYGATADVANNMKLVANGLALITNLDVQPAVNGNPVLRTLLYQLTAPATFQVQAIAAGAAGSVYNATLDVQEVGFNYPPSSYAVYMDVLDQEPKMQGVLL
jgi:hypothetical protein